MVNNLNDGVAWGLFPLLYTSHGLTVGQIGVLAAVALLGKLRVPVPSATARAAAAQAD